MITMGMHDIPYLARGFPWDPFTRYADYTSVSGLKKGRRWLRQPWVLRNNPLGLIAWEPWTDYDDTSGTIDFSYELDGVTGLDRGWGFTEPWLYRRQAHPRLYAYDSFNSYTDDADVGGLNGGNGFEEAYVSHDVSYGSVDDEYNSMITLNTTNGYWERDLPCGGTWSRIRIGILYSVDDAGGNISDTPKFIFGVGSSGTYCCGFITVSGTWTRTAATSTNHQYYKGTSGGTLLGRWSTWLDGVHSSKVDVNNQSIMVGNGSDSPQGRRILVLDLTKGTTTWTCRALVVSAVDKASSSLMTKAELQNQTTVATSALVSHTYGAASTPDFSALNSARNKVILYFRCATSIYVHNYAMSQFA